MPSRGRRFTTRGRLVPVLGHVLAPLAVTLAFLVVAEALLRVTYTARTWLVDVVPLPYAIGHAYGPEPPWLDQVRMLEPDPRLIWRPRPYLRQTYLDVFSPVERESERRALHQRFLPGVPAALRGNPVWTVALNSRGFRDDELPEGKPAGVFRIVCLGDSWTFGSNVDYEQAYPRQLERLFRAAFPDVRIEVVNLGVMGFSSHQGLTLLRETALALEPDVVVIGFGMNDSRVPGYRDADMVAELQRGGIGRRLLRLIGKLHVYRLVRYLALRMKDRPRPVAEYFADATREPVGAARAAVYGGLEAWTRVPLADFERNIREMIALARSRDAGVLLLFNEIWSSSPYGEALARTARAERVPMVDSSALLAAARGHIAADLERRLALRPPRTVATVAAPGAAADVRVIFRVHAGDHPVPRHMSIVGSHPSLGGLVPNTVTMRDDGTGADQRAGDRVWSYAAWLPRGAKIAYAYTNSGDPGRWQGMDVPDIRTFSVEPGAPGTPLVRPIDTFGKLYVQADAWHPDADGYRLLARAAFDVLRGDEHLRRYLARVRGRRPSGDAAGPRTGRRPFEAPHPAGRLSEFRGAPRGDWGALRGPPSS